MLVEPGVKKESVTKQKEAWKTQSPSLSLSPSGVFVLVQKLPTIVKLCRNTRHDSVVAGGLHYLEMLADLAKLFKDKHTQQI